MNLDYDVNELKTIVAQAKKAAYEAASDYLVEKLDGKDNYPCGFAWVNIHGIKGNTKLKSVVISKTMTIAVIGTLETALKNPPIPANA